MPRQEYTFAMIPWRLRQAIKPVQFAVGLKALKPMHPSASVLRWLHSGWSNEGWSGDPGYLEAVWQHALKARRILECGSGLSTILLGEIAKRTGAEIWSLEHIPEWQQKVDQTLARYDLPNRVSVAPLRSFGNFDWYSLPDDLPGDFDLVICDGPPGATRGGRYGLLPVCGDRISHATILLDDAERTEEQAIIDRWQLEFGLVCRTVTAGSGAFAVLAKP